MFSVISPKSYNRTGELKMKVGDKVIKVGGSFQHTGTLVAVFQTTAGTERVVIEFDNPVSGMLHVYRPDQVKPLITSPSKPDCIEPPLL
jgi:hypothetical protein